MDARFVGTTASSAARPIWALRTPVAMAAALALVLLGTTACDVQQTVQDALAQASQLVTNALAEATAAANGVIVTAASQLQVVINDATTELEGVLTEETNRVDATVSSVLAKVNDQTRALNGMVAADLDKATDDATALIQQLDPFANQNPIVRDYSPKAVTAKSAADGVVLTLKGSFPKASLPGYAPTVKLNGKTVTNALVTSTTTQLQFALPPRSFPATASPLASPAIEADLPTQVGKVFTHVAPGAFHLFVATLPDSPLADATLSTWANSGTPGTVANETSGTLRLNSFDCQVHSQTFVVTPPSGLTIVPGSATISRPIRTGRVDPPTFVPSPTPNSLAVRATTYPNPSCESANALAALGADTKVGGDTYPPPEPPSGSLQFTVSYAAKSADSPVTPTVCHLNEPAPGCPDLSLGWGSQKVYDVPQSPGHWTLTEVLFDGQVVTASSGVDAAEVDFPLAWITSVGAEAKANSADVGAVALAMFGQSAN